MRLLKCQAMLNENLIGISQQGIIEDEESVDITGVEVNVALEMDSHVRDGEKPIGISRQGITED